MNKMQKRKTYTAFILVSPVLAGVLVFFLIPFIVALWYSLTFGVGGAEFVGLANYLRVARSPAFMLAAKNTVKYILMSVPLTMVISFIVAILLRRNGFASGLFRSALLFPMVVPIAGTIMVVQVFFNDRGIINSWLANSGMNQYSWLNSDKAFVVLVGMYIWKNLGYIIILMLSGMNMIPKELFEIAEIEGAKPLQVIRKITLPLMGSTLFMVMVLSIINCFKSFREAMVLGGTHPHDSIYMLQHFMNNNFENLNYQRLSVAAVMIFILIFLIVGLLYKAQNKLDENSL